MKNTALTSCCVDFFPEQNQVYVGCNSLNFATQYKNSGKEDVSVIVGDRYFKADSWQGGAFDTFRLSEPDWKMVHESDLIAMPAGDPNLKDLLSKRHSDQLVAIDFLDYPPLDFIEQHFTDIDIVFLSGQEGSLVRLQALETNYRKIVVSTLGAKGSIAFHNGSIYKQQAIEVEKIVDTTGCGDAFQAAFCIAWLETKDIKRAMRANALTLGSIGVSLSFLPQEIAQYMHLGSEPIVLQLLGSLYVGFSLLNWMNKEKMLGGIYGKPVVMANFAHFML